MKRFQISFPVDGQNTDLFVESMDNTHTRFSIERNENDPHPLLLEHDSDTTWRNRSQDAWSLTEKEINTLGCKIANECDTSTHISTGINAT